MATTNSTPALALAHVDAIRVAANAVARYEYGCDLNDLIPAQQRICEGFAATAIGAYLDALKVNAK
jgi:hypothetical protein